MFGCAFPCRSGSRPVTSAFWATFTSPARPLSSSGTSIRAPSPPCSAREHRGGCVEPGEHVHERHADLVRRPVLGPGDRHQPGLGLRDEVVAGAAGRLALGAEARDRAVDDARVALAHAARSPRRAGPRPPTLKFSITMSARAHSSSASARPSGCDEVERAAALAAVDRQVVGGLAAREGRAPGARLVAALGPLDLDDVRAEVGEHHRAVGAGEHAREVGHRARRRAGGAGRFPMSSPSSGILTGARAAVAALEDAGVSVAFGLPGVHNLAAVARAERLADPAGGRAPRADGRLRGRRLRPRERPAGRRAHHHRARARRTRSRPWARRGRRASRSS